MSAVDPSVTIRRATPADLPAARAIMLRILEEDFRIGYDPAVSWDIGDLEGIYLGHPRRTLVVAVDADGQVIGTAGVRGGRLRGGPTELVQRYADEDATAQLVRVYILREHRRRGLGRALLRAVLRFVLDDGRYRVITLHTFPHSPGALPFWASVGDQVGEITDERGMTEVFFEIPLERARALVDA